MDKGIDIKSRAREERIIISFNKLIKTILAEELNKRNTNLSEFLRGKIEYVVNNNKQVKIINPTSHKFSFQVYKRDTTITFKVDTEVKEKFKELLIEGTISGFVNLQISEAIPELLDKKYSKIKDFINHKVLMCIEKTETENEIIYYITKGESRLDIYLEPVLKDKYTEIINKLGIDYSTHLRYFVSKAVERNVPIETPKTISGNRSAQITILVNKREYEQFKALFKEGSSMSSYFREIIIEEMKKVGIKIQELLLGV